MNPRMHPVHVRFQLVGALLVKRGLAWPTYAKGELEGWSSRGGRARNCRDRPRVDSGGSASPPPAGVELLRPSSLFFSSKGSRELEKLAGVGGESLGSELRALG